MKEKILNYFTLHPKLLKGIIFSLLIVLLVIIDIGLQMLPGINIVTNYFSDLRVFFGIIFGFGVVLWGLYWLAKILKEKIEKLADDGSILWVKSVQGAAKLINAITSLVGYPSIELAKLNVKVTEESIKLLRDFLEELLSFLQKICIFGSMVLGSLLLIALFPQSILVGIILVALVIISFAIMGITEPLVKPLEGKNIRNVIRPISIILPIMGSIFLLYMHGPEIYHSLLNPFSVYLIFLLTLSFRSYHGKYISNMVRGTMTFTVVVLFASLILLNLGFYESEEFELIKHKREDWKEMVKSANANEVLNITYIADTTFVFTKVSKDNLEAAVDGNGNFLILLPRQEVAKINAPIVYIGAEGFTPVRVKNEFGLYIDEPIYVPTKNIGSNSQTTKHTETLPKPTEKIQETEEVILEHNFPVGTRYRIYSASGQGFKYLTSSQGWTYCPSGQMVEVKIPPPNPARVIPNLKGDRVWIERQ